MSDSILSNHLAALYLRQSRKPKRTSIHFKIDMDSRKKLEDKAQAYGVTTSEYARISLFKNLHSND